MADISTWLKDLLPRTPGASRVVVGREFINMAREFYEQSLSWRVTLTAVDLVADTAEYTLTPPSAESVICGVLGVQVDNRDIPPSYRKPTREDQGSNRPSTWYITAPATVRLFPTPSAALTGGLVPYVALMPAVAATTLPEISLVHHYEALLDGAFGRLYAHPAKPYSNVAGAEYHLRRFRNAIALHRGEAKLGNIGAAAWRFPAFAK